MYIITYVPSLPQSEKQKLIPESCTLALLEMLPTVQCINPREVLPLLNKGAPAEKILMDMGEFKNRSYQSVCQNLKDMHSAEIESLHKMSESKSIQAKHQFKKGIYLPEKSHGKSAERSPYECLECILK